jgi:uncharacterized protein (TIGR02271 family)
MAGKEADEVEHAHLGGQRPHAHEDVGTTRDTARAARTRDEVGEKIQLREEELRVHKEPMQTGEVRIRKEVVSEEKILEVPIIREEVIIERRPTEPRPATRPIGEAEVISVPVHEEHVIVEKQPVVTEEILVGKQPVQETKQVAGTIRREEVFIERAGDIDVERSTQP